ncbi:MAG: hypothetical protein K2X77_00015 [Candidatus Obscuribacterales bacterium]|nr:hypothetical protein [Candidatus Obscuribacterales bacterium]
MSELTQEKQASTQVESNAFTPPNDYDASKWQNTSAEIFSSSGRDKTEQLAFHQADTKGPIELKEEDFGKIGPKAAEVMKGAGVNKVEIEPGDGFDTVTATLKEPLEIAQDPEKDGSRKLKVDTTFKADISVKEDGTIVLDNIEGLKAEVKALGRWRDADVSRVEIKKGEDGQTEVKSTGGIGIFSRTQTRIKPGEIMDKAKILIDRFNDLKKDNSTNNKQGSLDLPRLLLG